MSYDPAGYWETAHDRDDLSAVGQNGYSAAWNTWLYRAWLANGEAFLEERQVYAKTVCDVGAGRGSWFDVWRRRGATSITAVDLVANAVGRLDGVDAVQADISRPGSLAGHGPFDLVAAMWVLLHVTDDPGFGTALGQLAALTAPGGHLLIAEPIHRGRPRPRIPGATSVVRPIEEYAFPGLRLVAVRAATVVAGDPVDHRGVVARGLFGVTSRIGSRFPSVLGPPVSSADRWLWRHTSWAPSAKLALYKRPR